MANTKPLRLLDRTIISVTDRCPAVGRGNSARQRGRHSLQQMAQTVRQWKADTQEGMSGCAVVRGFALADVRFECVEKVSGDFNPDNLNIDWNDLADIHLKGGYATLRQYMPFAIKIYRNTGEDGAKEAESEFKIMMDLNKCMATPNVYAWGFIVDDSNQNHVRRPALIEDWVYGVSLKDIWKEDGAFSEEQLPGHPETRLQAAVAVSQAVADVHGTKEGVCHRDLAPANVILNTAGHPFSAKIVDFGQSTSQNSVVTPNEWARLAQWSWGAPEVYGGDHYGKRNEQSVDVWSLGALCCYLLAATDEFWVPIPNMHERAKRRFDDGRDKDAKELVVELKKEIDVRQQLETALGSYNFLVQPSVQKELVDILQECLSFDPALRPKARTVADILTKYRDSVTSAASEAYKTPVSLRQNGSMIIPPPPVPHPKWPDVPPYDYAASTNPAVSSTTSAVAVAEAGGEPSSSSLPVVADVLLACAGFLVGLIAFTFVIDVGAGEQLGTTIAWCLQQMLG